MSFSAIVMLIVAVYSAICSWRSRLLFSSSQRTMMPY